MNNSLPGLRGSRAFRLKYRASLLVGLVAIIAAVGLLAASGWFLTASALASAAGMALGFDFFRPGAVVRLAAIWRTVGRYGERVLSHDAILEWLASLRLWVWQRWCAAYPDRQGRMASADALQRVLGDVDALDHWLLRGKSPLIWALGCLVLVTLLLLWLLPTLALMVLTPLWVASLLVPWLSYLAAKPLVAAQQQLAWQQREQLLTMLAGMMTLVSCGLLTSQHQRWLSQQQLLQSYADRITRIQWRGAVVIQLAIVIAVAGALLLGAPQVLAQQISGAWLAALVLGLLGLGEVLTPLSLVFISALHSQLSKQRLLAIKPVIKESSGGQPLTHIERLQLVQLDCRQADAYHQPKALSCTLTLGQSVLLQGNSGVGKSTLAQVIAGQLNAQGGQVLLNGLPHTQYQPEDLATQIHYQQQQVYLFNQSIAANLRLADAHAEDAQLWQVLELVELAGWVNELPQGLNTVLGEHGTRLSGGQTRRLVLARTLLTKATLLVLDEPFEGLDSAMRERICQRLLPQCATRILMVISHHDIDYSDFTYRLQLESHH